VADPNVPTPEERIDPTANLQGWLDKHTQEASAEPDAQPEPVAEPATEVTPEPEVTTQPVNWREAVIEGDDVGYGFFKGKKVPEVIKSYTSLLADYQAKAARLAQFEREQELARQAQAAPPAASQPDYAATIENKLYEDPRVIATSVVELARAEARQEFAEQARRAAAQQEVITAKTGHEQLVTYVAEQYGMEPRRAAKIVIGTYPQLKQMYEAQGVVDAFTNPNHAWNEVREMLGDPRPAVAPVAIQAPPVPQLSDPPGSSRPKSTPPNVKASPLSDEVSKTYEAVAKIAGLDPDRMKARAARHKH
jgi:hypothetical protein